MFNSKLSKDLEIEKDWDKTFNSLTLNYKCTIIIAVIKQQLLKADTYKYIDFILIKNEQSWPVRLNHQPFSANWDTGRLKHNIGSSNTETRDDHVPTRVANIFLLFFPESLVFKLDHMPRAMNRGNMIS